MSKTRQRAHALCDVSDRRCTPLSWLARWRIASAAQRRENRDRPFPCSYIARAIARSAQAARSTWRASTRPRPRRATTAPRAATRTTAATNTRRCRRPSSPPWRRSSRSVARGARSSRTRTRRGRRRRTTQRSRACAAASSTASTKAARAWGRCGRSRQRRVRHGVGVWGGVERRPRCGYGCSLRVTQNVRARAGRPR